MGRIPEGIARKDSRKWLQKIVNQKPELLDSLFKSQLKIPKFKAITRLSPLASDNFAEYQDKAFLNLPKIRPSKVSLKEFWPTRGPVWDRLAPSDSGRFF